MREVVQRDKVGETETGASDTKNVDSEERLFTLNDFILPVE